MAKSKSKSKPKPSITQQLFQRKWLEIKLDCGSLTMEEEATLLGSLEDLDLRIAATPCDTVQDLCLKLERLADLIYPSDQPIPENCLEHLMLAAVINDARVLAHVPLDQL